MKTIERDGQKFVLCESCLESVSTGRHPGNTHCGSGDKALSKVTRDMKSRNNHGIYLHEIESSRGIHSVRICTPSYDPKLPGREISAGWWSGVSRGILIQATEVSDLREIARVLNEAADQLETR